MKITYLGQAGLLFQTENCNIMIDPYQIGRAHV